MTDRTEGEHRRRRDLVDAAYGHPAPRLLPWTTDDGRPCYLLTNDSRLATVADQIEGVQLGMSRDVLKHSRQMLNADRTGPALSANELRWLAHRLSECLDDIMRVAESRGARPPNATEDGPQDTPRPSSDPTPL